MYRTVALALDAIALSYLVAATRLGGQLMDMPAGEIKVGWLADLLLVDGDPTRDVKVLQSKENLRSIMKGGHFHKQPLVN
jgi:imidazolonepropionase-like amidohydrolase